MNHFFSLNDNSNMMKQNLINYIHWQFEVVKILITLLPCLNKNRYKIKIVSINKSFMCHSVKIIKDISLQNCEYFINNISNP